VEHDRYKGIQKAVAGVIKEALVDCHKLHSLIGKLDIRGYKSAVDTLENFQYYMSL
jgi:hypothetical protein